MEEEAVLWIQRPGQELVKIDLYSGTAIDLIAVARDVKKDITEYEGIEARIFVEILL